MTGEMRELMRATPIVIHIVLFVMFIFISSLGALMIPIVAFAIGAFVLMCFVHTAVNLPAIRCMEDNFYGADPQRFFDIKVKFAFQLWAIGIVIMVIIFIAVAGLWSFSVNTGLTYSYEVPQIDPVSSLILIMVSLTPFIPATFALMKASYRYDGGTMWLVSFILGPVGILGILIAVIIFLTGTPSGYVPIFHTLEILPLLPLSICAFAASLIATFYLIKSAKRSFTEYIESDKV